MTLNGNSRSKLRDFHLSDPFSSHFLSNSIYFLSSSGSAIVNSLLIS